jgi:hypothetical protein
MAIEIERVSPQAIDRLVEIGTESRDRFIGGGQDCDEKGPFDLKPLFCKQSNFETGQSQGRLSRNTVFVLVNKLDVRLMNG